MLCHKTKLVIRKFDAFPAIIWTIADIQIEKSHHSQ